MIRIRSSPEYDNPHKRPLGSARRVTPIPAEARIILLLDGLVIAKEVDYVQVALLIACLTLLLLQMLLLIYFLPPFRHSCRIQLIHTVTVVRAPLSLIFLSQSPSIIY